MKASEKLKEELLKSVNEIHEEMIELTKAGSCGEYSGGAEYEDTKEVINSVINSPIVGNLLFLFWQRKSDACPLDDTEASEQEHKFKEWIKTIDLDMVIASFSQYCMPDGINSKEDHDEYLKAIGLKKKN